MELRTVGYFVAVVDAGTMTRAAVDIGVTQPALSRQLRQLERQLGVELFDRSGGRLHLSPAGAALLPRARVLLAEAENLQAAARMLRQGGLRRITIAAPETTLTDIVSPFLTTLAEGDPVPDVLELAGGDIDAALRAGADLVITQGRTRAPVDELPLPPLPVLAYVPPTHQWAARTSVSLAELTEAVTIGLPVGARGRDAVDAAVRDAGLRSVAPVEVSNGTVAQALAAAGRGVAVVTDDPRFDLVPLRIEKPAGGTVTVRLHCTWPRHHPAADVIAALADRLVRWVERQYA